MFCRLTDSLLNGNLSISWSYSRLDYDDITMVKRDIVCVPECK